MSVKVALNVDTKVISHIVESISDAVGDKIKEDMAKLKTNNSEPARIWDFLNTDLCNYFNSGDCMAYNTKRGPWKMIMVFEKSTGYLYTFMREQRFFEVQSKIGKRKRMHYLDMLTRHLNVDLSAPVGQTTLLPVSFEDQDELELAIKKLLRSLVEDDVVLKRHVLVLFESSRYQLTKIRAVMVDTNLDVVCEQNWSSFISVDESVVVEKVVSVNNASNNPTRGLEITAKAAAKAAARKNTNTLRENEDENLVKKP